MTIDAFAMLRTCLQNSIIFNFIFHAGLQTSCWFGDPCLHCGTQEGAAARTQHISQVLRFSEEEFLLISLPDSVAYADHIPLPLEVVCMT